MKTRILSHGSVSPAGIGLTGCTTPWTESRSQAVSLIGKDSPVFSRWGKEPRIRRASPLSYYLMEAAEQALAAIPNLDRKRVGLVTAFFLGNMVYTVKFYRQITEEGRRFGSPILFPETVFNSPASHVAATLGLGGPIYSQIGDKSSWVNALRTAECWLKIGSADHVLVMGAEEFDSHVIDALRASRLLTKNIPISEGAGAILLGKTGDGPALSAISDGHSFTNRKNARFVAREGLADFYSDYPVISTATGWDRPVQEFAATGREVLSDDSMPCEAFTASAAWDTIRAMGMLQTHGLKGIVIPHWGLAQQTGFVCLEK